MMQPRERFRLIVRFERERRGWSQAEVAELLTDRGVGKIHPTTIAKIEYGDREVKVDEAAALADLFEVSLDVMLGRKQSQQRASSATSEFLDDVLDAIAKSYADARAALEKADHYVCMLRPPAATTADQLRTATDNQVMTWRDQP